MGEVASVNYGHEKEHACDKCGMEQKDGCCHTEHKILKSEEDHLNVKSATINDTWFADSPQIYFDEILYDYTSSQYEALSNYSPPVDYRLNDLHLYNSVFRI